MDVQKFYNERKKDLLIKKGPSRDYVSESDVVALLKEYHKEQLALCNVVGRSEQLKCRCENCGCIVASKIYLDCYGKCQSCTTAF